MSRKFAIRLILFISLLVVINVILDWSFKAFSVHNTLNNMMDKQFAEYDDTLKYLAVGNSHNCINTHILQQSFNYGSPSESFIQSYYKLKYILEKTGKKPEYLILQADLSSFGPKISDRYEYNSYWIKYIDYRELARIKDSKDMLYKWLEGKFFSYVGNYKDVQLSILYRIKMGKVEMYHGYRAHRDYHNFADEPDKQKTAWDKANLILSKEEYFDPAIRVYFEKILQLCQDHGVKVIMVRMPMTKEFNIEEGKLVPEQKLLSEVQAITSKYPNFVRALDYHDLFEDHPDYFFDPDHLNIKGADLFTTRLAEDLKKLDSGGFPE
jgi:hypothetical protein